jgi:hypothetical protein
LNEVNKSNQESFELIRQRLPQRLNRFSSVWWFFLLFPRQANGYGPKQMMFSLVALVGKRVRINQTWHQGLDRQSIIDANQEQFPALALGWINDGTQVHEELVHQPCLATSSRHGPLSAWADGTGYGADMRAIDDKPFGIEAHFEGPKGYGRFQVWGDPSYQLATPAAVFDWHTRLGGVHVVGWPRFNFEGDFCHPNGTESLAGIGYFQRVCFNLPLPPWKWVYVVF